MNKLNRAIRESLAEEDAALFDRLGDEQALSRQVLATFTGELWWLNIVGWVVGVALFAVACLCGWQFLQAPTVASMLKWGAAAALAVGGLLVVKVWFWLELQKNAIVREVKRLELQVASLTAQLRRS